MTADVSRPDGPGEVPQPSSPASLADELRERVARKRKAGEYPPDLEDRLAGHFERVMQHRETNDRLKAVRKAMIQLAEVSHFSPGRADTRSRMLAGERYHELIGRTVARHIQPVIAQMQAYADAIAVVLGRLIERLDDPGSHTHSDLLDQIDSLLDRMGRLELAPEGPAAEMATLRERVAALEAVVNIKPWYDQAGYAARLGRPSEDEAGADLEPVLTVLPADGLGPLVECDDASLGAITVPGGVEQLHRQAVVDLPVLAWMKLRIGGRLIVSGIDPASPEALSRAGTDPLWRGPVHPDLLDFLFQAAGFSGTELTSKGPSEYRVSASR